MKFEAQTSAERQSWKKIANNRNNTRRCVHGDLLCSARHTHTQTPRAHLKTKWQKRMPLRVCVCRFTGMMYTNNRAKWRKESKMKLMGASAGVRADNKKWLNWGPVHSAQADQCLYSFWGIWCDRCVCVFECMSCNWMIRRAQYASQHNQWCTHFNALHHRTNNIWCARVYLHSVFLLFFFLILFRELAPLPHTL